MKCFIATVRLATAAAALAGMLALAPTHLAGAAPASSAATPTHDAAVTAGPSCSPGTWTQVNVVVNPFWPQANTYWVDNGVLVEWRWWSVGPIPSWSGYFWTSGTIVVPPAPYTSIEFRCSAPSAVHIV